MTTVAMPVFSKQNETVSTHIVCQPCATKMEVVDAAHICFNEIISFSTVKVSLLHFPHAFAFASKIK